MDRSISFLTSYPDIGRRLSAPRIAYRLVFARRAVARGVMYLEDTYRAEMRQARRAGRGSVVLLQREQLALAPDAGERAPVDRAGPVRVERGQVLGRRIALVAGEAVRGELAIGLEHDPVARDLRNDRRRRHARAAPVAGDEVLLRTGQGGEGDEVGDDQLRHDGEPRERLRHGPARGLADADPVDRLVLDGAPAGGQGVRTD